MCRPAGYAFEIKFETVPDAINRPRTAPIGSIRTTVTVDRRNLAKFMSFSDQTTFEDVLGKFLPLNGAMDHSFSN